MTSSSSLSGLWNDKVLDDSLDRDVENEDSDRGFQNDLLHFFEESGLESLARDGGLIGANGELVEFSRQQQSQQAPSGNTESSVKIPSTIHKRPLSTYSTSLGTFFADNTIGKRPYDTNVANDEDLDVKKHRFGSFPGSGIGEKGGKGLRHFSMKVCQKVQQKGVTTYNEVADELVAEFIDPSKPNFTPEQMYDQKNIRRRVYDALNVLMAMSIISKEKKEIKWIGLPTNSAQEMHNLEVEKQKRIERITHKRQQLQELILQQIAFKNLVRKNKEAEAVRGAPEPNTTIKLPFIVVNTNRRTVVDCSISYNKHEYLFNFDNSFEIHDDIEVLKRMGLCLGLESGQATTEQLQEAEQMVPKSLVQHLYSHTGHSAQEQTFITVGTSMGPQSMTFSPRMGIPTSAPPSGHVPGTTVIGPNGQLISSGPNTYFTHAVGQQHFQSVDEDGNIVIGTIRC